MDDARCVIAVKDKYGDVDLDDVADDNSDSSSSEDEDAVVLCNIWSLCFILYLCICVHRYSTVVFVSLLIPL